MDDTPVPQEPTARGRKAIAWQRDSSILQRMAEVERRHFAGESTYVIAAALGVSDATVRADLKRLTTLWLERTGEQTEVLRARAIRRLDDIVRRALDAAEFDEAAERAVLFGEDMQGNPLSNGAVVEVGDGGQLKAVDAPSRRVHRDDKGSAQFRGNKAAAINVARAALMDIAKIQGIVIDKLAATDADGKALDLAALLRLARETSDGRG